ncbi:hypothetical protein ACLQ25_00335 [Micromonospora sp. DT44]|uniref:hypothetical protein n=1 Tax=Micromonospora sp. DT44 TaxID=3393439 RepID=UPI003CF4F6F9
MAPWEQQPDQNWRLYNEAGDVVGTRARNPDVSPREAMVGVWENLPASALVESAVHLGQEALAQFNSVERLVEDATPLLEQPVPSGNLLEGLADQLGRSIAGIDRAVLAMETTIALLDMVKQRWGPAGTSTAQNVQIIRNQTRTTTNAIDSIKIFLRLQRDAATALSEARRLGLQHPGFGEAHHAAIQSLGEIVVGSFGARLILRANAEDVANTSGRLGPLPASRSNLPEDLVNKLAGALRGGVYTDSKPYGAQHPSTTQKNAEVTQAVITLLNEAGMSDHQMARQAYHARQQHRGEVFPAVDFYPENSRSRLAASLSIGNRPGQGTTDVATTSNHRATTPPPRPHRR